MAGTEILGVILAGGRSRRMGRDKALLQIGGVPLVAHVARRLAPQVARLVLNANGDTARFGDLGIELIGDSSTEEAGFAGKGPLAGIAAALGLAERSGFSHLATAPVDAPLLPLDLVARLAAGAQGEIAVAAWQGGMEPLFALWPAGLAPRVASALAEGERAVYRAIRRLPHRLVEFATAEGAPSPFLNLNTPEDVAYFERSTAGMPKS